MTEQTHGTPPFLMRCLTADEWLDYIAGYDFGTIPPSRAVLHHTWKPTVQDWQGEASMLGMQNYYASLGWSAAPHIYVAPDGIWLATPMCDVGVHAGIGNSGYWNGAWGYSIGIEMVGDYDTQRPSGTIWELTKTVLGGLSQRLDIAPQQLVWFHRAFSIKTCPGRAVTKTWVWSEVEAWLDGQQKPAQPAPAPHPMIDSRFQAAWEASGGIWQPERLTPGFPVAPAEVGDDGNLQQRFERGIAVLVNGQVHWRLISEVLADYSVMKEMELITGDSAILAAPRATAQQARAYIIQRGTSYADYDVGVIVGHYWTLCPEVGVDPLVAIAQCILETDNLNSWWSQRPRRNPAGIGVNGYTGKLARPGWQWDSEQGVYRAGLAFESWEIAARAHIGRLLAYALRDDEATSIQRHVIDEALSHRDLPLSYRGCAKTLKALNGKWAVPGLTYGQSIADLAERIRA